MSSSSVNSGKKIAIGGSMTETTQPVPRSAPLMSAPDSQAGTPQESEAESNSLHANEKNDESSSEG